MKPARCRRVLRALGTGACVACPLAAYAAARSLPAGPAALALTWAPLLLLGAWSVWRSRRRAWLAPAAAGIALLMWLGHGWLLAHLGLAFVLEHVGSLGLLGWMFGSTLRASRVPLVTRLAATSHPAMSDGLRRYTRAVTLAWTMFFAATACLSLLIFRLDTLPEWALFASVWTPALVVAMFVAEYAVRRVAVPPVERSGPWEAVRAYLRYAAAQRAQGIGASSRSPSQ